MIYIYQALDKCKSNEVISNAIFYNSIINNTSEVNKLIDIFIKHYPNDNYAKSLKAFEYLKKENFEEGWQAYRHRECNSSLLSYIKNHTNIHEWDIESQPDSLLILTEQGIGDEVMFMQLLKLIDYENISLCLDHRLIKIVKDSFPDLDTISKDEVILNTKSLDKYTHYTLLGDLCSKFVKDVNSLSSVNQSFLVPNKKNTKNLKNRMKNKTGINVGFSWHTTNINRFTSNLNEEGIKLLNDHIQRGCQNPKFNP